jgi:surfactin synthase thioesterase subunit
LHVQGRIELNESGARQAFPSVLFDEIIDRCKSEYSGLMFYQILNECGLRLGPSVQWIEQLWHSESEVLARFRLPLKSESKTAYGLGVSPGVHDACAQLFYIFLQKTGASDMKFMVPRWKNFAFNLNHRSDEIWCHVRLEKLSVEEGNMKGSYSLYNSTGHSWACVDECSMKVIGRQKEEAIKRTMEQIQTISLAGNDEALIESLKAATDTERKQIMQNYLHESIVKLLKMRAGELSTSKSLLEIGMDSLVGFECKTKIEKALDISLPVQVLIEGPSINDLANQILSIENIEPEKLRNILRVVFPDVPELSKDDLVQVLTFLLADLKIVESYRYKPEPDFDVPITAFHGKNDVVVKDYEMKSWGEMTSAFFEMHVLDGDHLFLKNARERTVLLNLIGKDLVCQLHEESNKNELNDVFMN